MLPFTCDSFGHTVNKPCLLVQCGFNTQSTKMEFSGNCIKRYLSMTKDNQSAPELSMEEVAMTLGMDISNVRKLHKTAMRKVSENALLAKIEDGELRSNVYYVPNLSMCVVCEARVCVGSGGSEIRDITDNLYYYCSDRCMSLKPLYELILEIRFGVTIDKLFTWVLSNFGSLTAAERALSITRAQMKELAKKYSSTPLENNFEVLREVSKRRRYDLVRRTWHYPKIFSERADSIRTRLYHKVEARYGIIDVDVSGVMEATESLLTSC